MNPVFDELVVSDRTADLRHVVRVTDQMLRGIEHALAGLTGKDRQRLERQRRMLTRARDEAGQELAYLEFSISLNQRPNDG